MELNIKDVCFVKELVGSLTAAENILKEQPSNVEGRFFVSFFFQSQLTLSGGC